MPLGHRNQQAMMQWIDHHPISTRNTLDWIGYPKSVIQARSMTDSRTGVLPYAYSIESVIT